MSALSQVPWTERELRRLMVKACSALSRKNLVAATDGNVSARLGYDRVLVTPSGVSKGDVGELDILLCDMDGRRIRGRGESSSEVHVHLAAYRNREDIGAVVHAHPPIASAFTFAGLQDVLREPIVPEVVAQIGPIPCVPYIQPGTRALAEAVGKALRDCDVVLMAQHGAATVAKDPWAAYLRMEKLEHFATIVKTARELAASEGQKIRTLSDEQVNELRAGYGKGKIKSASAGAVSIATTESGSDAIVERIAAEVLARLHTSASK
jgi:L-fuculose-phosphate aldolase